MIVLGYQPHLSKCLVKRREGGVEGKQNFLFDLVGGEWSENGINLLIISVEILDKISYGRYYQVIMY